MLELLAAGAALIGRALLQAADAALLAIGEDEAREIAEEPNAPSSARWLLELKQDPEPTAAALRAMSSGLLAFAAVACAIVAGNAPRRRRFKKSRRSSARRRAPARTRPRPSWCTASSASPSAPPRR